MPVPVDARGNASAPGESGTFTATYGHVYGSKAERGCDRNPRIFAAPKDRAPFLFEFPEQSRYEAPLEKTSMQTLKIFVALAPLALAACGGSDVKPTVPTTPSLDAPDAAADMPTGAAGPTTPAAEPPKADPPKAEEPKKEEPKADPPKAEEPKKEDPKKGGKKETPKKDPPKKDPPKKK